MATTAEQVRSYRGPAILSFGFRPFFLSAAIWAALVMVLWLPVLAGQLVLPTALGPIEWHAHALLYGFVPAAVAGFLLTAVPNWTGRLPVTGKPLLALFLLWLAGRIAVFTSGWIGAPLAAVIDLSFLATLAAVVAREIIAGKSTRNLKVLIVLGVLFLGNVTFHAEILLGLGAEYGIRAGIAAIILLIMLIGGRIIPSFTRNWLVRRSPGRLPVPFSRFDAAVMAFSGAALALWIVLPEADATAVLAVFAGLLNVVRLGRWAGERTTAEQLVLVLHVAYAFIPLGFLLLATSIWAPEVLLPSGALHAWTAGAMGLMIMAVMTRASLGHTGQPLTATRGITAIYIATFIAALARIVAGFGVAREPMLHLSATAWVVGFAGFAVIYAPLLTRPRG
ncbi:MAG TPA: NnrS family protein [Hyphomicrobiaceae bacterium]